MRSSRRLPLRTRRRDDDGAALLMVLAFIALVGVVAVAVSGYAFTTFKASEAVIQLDDAGAQSGDAGEQVSALVREQSTATTDCLAGPFGTTKNLTIDQTTTLGRTLSGTCTLTGSQPSQQDFGQTFAAILTSPGVDGAPVLEKDGDGATTFQGDVILTGVAPNSAASAANICFRRFAQTLSGTPTSCQTATSASSAGNPGPIQFAAVNKVQASLRVPSSGPGNVPTSQVRNSSGVGIAAPYGQPDAAFQYADPTAAGILAPWTAPNTADLVNKASPQPTIGACLKTSDRIGFASNWFGPIRDYSCLRYVAPGNFTATDWLLDATTYTGTTPDGGCNGWMWDSGGQQRLINCTVRGTIFRPGVYRFDTDLAFTSKGPQVSFAVAGTLAPGIENQLAPAPAAPDRCLVSTPTTAQDGVAFIFTTGHGVRFGSDSTPNPPEFTACGASAIQLNQPAPGQTTAPGGRPDVVIWQEPGATSHAFGVWALTAPNAFQSALTLHGSVYAPDGRVQAAVGMPGSGVTFGGGLVAYSLVVNTLATGSVGADVTTQQAGYHERQLDVSLTTCEEQQPGSCDGFEPYHAVIAVGDDLASTAWIKAYLPPGSQ